MVTIASEGAGFGLWDWGVLVAYALVLGVTGWVFSRRQRGADDYFLAGRSVPMWVAAVSVLATGTSAATFVGAPALAYGGNLTYLSSNLGMLLAAAILAIWFVPAFYRAGVTSIYEMIGRRYGTPAQRAASVAFLCGRVMASGARVYIAAIPAAMIVFGDDLAHHVAIAIVAMAFVGIVYTLAGGIGAVVWTDVVQAVVMIGAASVAALLLYSRVTAGGGELFDVLGAARLDDGSKLTIVSLSTSPDATYTLWTAIIAFTLLGVASYGVDQDLTQRMLTCKSAAKASWSIVSALVINLPVVALFMTIGLLLFALYQRGDALAIESPPPPDATRTVFLHYILTELPTGMRGLMMAGLFAAGLSSVNSALNAMSAATISDLYRPLAPGRSDRHYLAAGRVAVVAWGVALAAFACVCIGWHRGSGESLINFALGVMTFAYAGLLAVFASVIFTRRGSGASAIGAMVVGALVVFALQFWEREDDATGELKQVLAFPWRLTLGSLAAFAVCQLGASPPPESTATNAPSVSPVP